MSFVFNKVTFEDNTFNEKIREKLTQALNPGYGSSTNQDSSSDMNQSRRLDIIKSEIIVKKVNFPTIPQLEILDLDVSAQSKSLLKGICKISCKDAMLQITTEIEANLLLLYSNKSPSFVTPKFISNDSFTVPITMTFDHIELEAISNIFVKKTGVGISFNDVNLDFKFHCSIKLLQSSIEKRLKASMETVFKDVLPSIIFNMSQQWFVSGDSINNPVDNLEISSHLQHLPKTILDDTDLSDLSPVNMLQLSTLISSRQSLSLNHTSINTISTIPGCIERQNLHRFNFRIPSLYNYYAVDTKVKVPSSSMNLLLKDSSSRENTLPKNILDTNSYDLKAIVSIQSKIYERTGEEIVPSRRKIKMKKNLISSKKVKHSFHTNDDDKNLCISTQIPLYSSQLETPSKSSISSKLNEVDASINTPSLKSSKNLPSITKGRDESRKLNNSEDLYSNFNSKFEFLDLRNSLYSPIRGNKLYLTKKEGETSSSFLDKNKLNFVGLANGQSWTYIQGDFPPPYIEK